MDLSGRRALVTGGANGIGLAIVDELNRAGASVVIADINHDAAEHAAKERGGLAIALDVRSETDWRQAGRFMKDQAGGFDILVNNAGIERTFFLIDGEPEAFREMLDVNVIGPMLGIREAFRAMRTDPGTGGVIVNVASAAVAAAPPIYAAYACSKAALDRLTRAAALEAGAAKMNIRVNAVLPGLIAQTGMGDSAPALMVDAGLAPDVSTLLSALAALSPLGRIGSREDVARTVRWLCSDDAAFINGESIRIDGGSSVT